MEAFWSTKLKLPNTEWQLSGYSKSAYRSGFYVSGLNIMLDGGPQLFKKPGHIFITHTHADHIAELPLTMIPYVDNHDSDKVQVQVKVQVVCPEEAVTFLQNYISQLHTTNNLQDMSNIIDNAYTMVPVSQKYTAQRLVLNKQNMLLETVAADHRIPTVVYGFSTIKDKLDAKYATLSGNELKALKKDGVTITTEIIEKKFCYVLDTSIKIFEKSPFLLEYPVIIVECTFFMEDELLQASQRKHIHWLELKPYVISNPKSLFILTHFTQRWKDSEIRDFFNQIKEKENINNIHPWLPDIHD